ncbi:MAG: ATP-binding protein [Planctomycetota bacterium]
MNSIRTRILVFTLLSSWALILVSALVWYRSAEGVLVSQFDEALAVGAGSLATLMTTTDHGVELEFADELTPEFRPGPEAAYFEAWTADGEVVERSKSLLDHDLPFQPGKLGVHEYWNLRLPDGRAGRACRVGVEVLPVEAENEDENPPRPTGVVATIVVAEGRGRLDRALAALWYSVLVVGTLVAFGNLVLFHVVLTRGLRPLTRLGHDVASLDPADLPERLDLEADRKELRPTVTGLNVLLGRVREAMEREKRTTSNIAHELMTPIAELRSLTEVALKWPDKTDYALEALRGAHDVAVHMNGLAETILTLARCQEGSLGGVEERVDAGAAVEAAVRRHEAAARRRDVRVDVEVEPGLAFVSDPALLDVVLSVLVANAVDHGPPGSPALLRARRAGDRVVFTFHNRVVDLERADLEHIAEPFWQKSASRTERRHTGLGLSLASEVATALRGSLEFALQADEFSATLSLPDRG